MHSDYIRRGICMKKFSLALLCLLLLSVCIAFGEDVPEVSFQETKGEINGGIQYELTLKADKPFARYTVVAIDTRDGVLNCAFMEGEAEKTLRIETPRAGMKNVLIASVER